MNHLIHIGYPKTASNALRAWFAAHPQIAFADGGIAGFSTVYDIATGGAAAGREIRCRVTSGEGLATPHANVGRACVAYAADGAGAVAAAQARVCAELAALFPHACVLIVTRGFRTMLLSAYSQYVRTGGVRDFAGFCASGLEPVWDYDRLIGRYEAAFGPENVLVVPWEELRDDPSAFVYRLESRLGLDPVGPAMSSANAAVSRAALAWFPRLPRRLFVRAAAGRKLDTLARLLQRLRPLPLPSETDIPAALLSRLEAGAVRLRARAAYAPYLNDYGFAGAVEGSGGAEATAG